MQISALRKLLQLISPSDSPEELKLSEEISEQSPAESEKEESEMQNSDLEIEGDDRVDEEPILEKTVDGARVAHIESNRSHLTSSVPRAAKAPLGTMTKGELKEIRALFNNMDDNEIHRLYKKVTK